ncbi:MAG: DUF1178 family protein [Desulfobacterales bacterium]|nr:DUF1178 family protein [Desulfobacterales bacterium]
MIVFDLKCVNGHCFEGWFDDGDAYEEQKKNGLLTCPFCDDTSVSRAPSTFAIKSSPSVKHPPPASLDMEKLSRKVIHYVENNFDNVGPEFAKEALKIHYGASEPRNIRGVSTPEEEKTMEKEGIKFFKIPMPSQEDADA